MDNKKNIYQKMVAVKSELAKMPLKKSGKNAFAHYSYFELGDFLPQVEKLMNDQQLYSHYDRVSGAATLTITNCDNPEEVLHWAMGIPEMEIPKGNNAIQVEGSIDTYTRRYLYVRAFDLAETDGFDAETGAPASGDKAEKPVTQVEEIKASDKQIAFIKRLYPEDKQKEICKYYKINSIEEMNVKQASETISHAQKQKAGNTNE